MKRKRIEKIVTAAALIIVLFLFAFFLKNILSPLVALELNNDIEGARELLSSKGVAGGLSVVLIEALQMVVIFIPAEFIQVTSGLSYPFYIALLLCDLGVCFGATIIYFLVRVFRFETKESEKDVQQIEHIALHEKYGVSMLMYLLFITPVIPFGAICYYASSKNIRYGRYLLTVATGVIPSIITSNLIGAGVRSFIMNFIPLWVLLLVIVVMMGVLFILLWFVLDKLFFKGKDGTPDSAMYFIVKTIAPVWRKHKQKLYVHNSKLFGLKAPFVLLVNHASFYDFFYVEELLKDYNPAYVINHHIFTLPVLKIIMEKSGMIPKKILCPDTAALKIVRTVKAGYPVVVFPEGRLSPDGRGNDIIENATALYKKMGVPLVLANISGAYFTYPKWRNKFFRGDVSVTAERVITSEELKQMTVSELEEAIEQALFNASGASYASDKPLSAYRQKNKAKGLETLLYRCADCGELYSTETRNNELFCTKCGAVHKLDDYYLFGDSIRDIPAYYDRIKELERAELDSLKLETEVETKIFSDGKPRVRKEKGFCTLDKSAFTYRSESVEFEIPTERLPALAYSCGKEFELYYNNELYYFYPAKNRNQVARWSLFVDLLREERKKNEKKQ